MTTMYRDVCSYFTELQTQESMYCEELFYQRIGSVRVVAVMGQTAFVLYMHYIINIHDLSISEILVSVISD